MRLSVLILGILIGAIMFFQSLTGTIVSSAVNDQALEEAAGTGLFVAIFWFIACAFVLPFPLVSVFVFALAAIPAFVVSGDFPDMSIWGSLSLVLAVMSFFGWRGKRKDRREANMERQRQLERDNRMEALMRQQASHAEHQASRPCPSCGRTNPPDTRFCGACGYALTGTAQV